MAPSTLAGVARRVISQATHRWNAKNVDLGTSVLERPTQRDLLTKIIIEATSALRVTTAHWAPTRPKSANLASSTHLKAWKRKRIANCARLEHSRISTAKMVAKSAASSLTHEKVKTSANVSVTTEPTPLKILHADARVDSISLMTMRSQRVMSVT